jgi:hypothetical protein
VTTNPVKAKKLVEEINKKWNGNEEMEYKRFIVGKQAWRV